MIRSLQGKKTLVTGAASGIGRATALAAAAEGARLFLTDLRPDPLAAVVADITAAGGMVELSQAFDISDFDAVTAYAKQVHDQHGSLDVVMNVAGISAWGTVENLEHKHWRSLVEVNLMGPIHVIENFVPPMIAAGKGGTLVNVSSAAGLLALPWHAAYSASKFGLRGVSEVLRFDLERHHIGVYLVVPGAVRTGLVQTLEVAGIDKNSERFQRATKQFEKRAVTPEHAAKKILAGIKKRKFLIYTSPDIRVGYWFARKFAWPYEFVMRRANRRFNKFL